MPQQRGIVIELQTELAPDLPDDHGRRERDPRRADQPGLQRRRRHARGRHADAAHPARGARPGAAACVVEVADTGIGMDEDTRRRCLEPFFTTKGERGTGLGLAMVYGMVQRHGAEIEIDSALGTGTTVRLRFRRPRRDPAGARAAGQRRSKRRRGCASCWSTTTRSCSSRCATRSRPMATSSSRRNGGAGGHRRVPRRARPAASPSPWSSPTSACRTSTGARSPAAVKEASPATPVILLTGWGQRLVAEGDVPAACRPRAEQAAEAARAARGAGGALPARRAGSSAGLRDLPEGGFPPAKRSHEGRTPP